MLKDRSYFNTPLALIFNIILAYLVFFVCRVIFIAVNHSYFPDLSFSHLVEMFKGGLYFDTSAILYLNILYIFLMLIPLHYKEGKVYQQVTKGIFIFTNSIGVIMNLMDTVYFQYTNRRTTASVFHEFGNESNLGHIIGVELLNHWYLTLAAVLIIYFLFKAYRKPAVLKPSHYVAYYVTQTICLLVCIPLCIFGMRGGIGAAVRPITISNANQYVDRPIETAIVLNTPFSIIRTFNKKVFENPDYFPMQELAEIYTPVHQPTDSIAFTPKNVVVLIVESFGREYIGAFNEWLEGGKYKGYTPFVDSLAAQSLTFEHSFCNGRKSIDGMPSILSGIPMFVEPFFLTPASLNEISGIAGELKNKGYYSAFFHGAKNGSMGFQAFARATGFTDYFGRTEYNEDTNYNGDEDYDGTWAIWDEEFLQFYCDKMSSFKEPFMTSVFTASSHHPYVIREKYKEKFPEEGIVIHKCIRYTDYALRRFFEKASKQPWFKNTLFVLTSDHTNLSDHPEYQTEIGGFSSPILFYAPGDSTLRGRSNAIAQQIDIMPTVLGYLGYDKPFVAFGCDLLNIPVEETFAVNYLNGTYQYVKGDYLLQFDGTKTKAVYEFATDRLLKHNLVDKIPQQAQMERELKAIIQQYMERMNGNELVIK